MLRLREGGARAGPQSRPQEFLPPRDLRRRWRRGAAAGAVVGDEAAAGGRGPLVLLLGAIDPQPRVVVVEPAQAVRQGLRLGRRGEPLGEHALDARVDLRAALAAGVNDYRAELRLDRCGPAYAAAKGHHR